MTNHEMIRARNQLSFELGYGPWFMEEACLMPHSMKGEEYALKIESQCRQLGVVNQ